MSCIPSRLSSARIMLLNRPAALNALNSDMLNIITPQLQVWRDSNCSLIIFNSSSPKAFCAGGDVISLFKSPDPLFFKLEYQLNHFIGTTKKPILSILSGLVMGGGVGLSVHGPFRIATESTIFAMPETKIGFFPDVGGSFFLSRLDGNLGIFLGLVGYRLKGIDVLMAGIATHFVPQARLPQLIARLSEIQSDNFEIISSAIEEYVGDPVTVQEWENWTLGGGNREIIERCFKFDTIEEIISALSKETSQFSLQVLQTLESCSPTMLKVTLRQLRLGKTKSFTECLSMEYNIAQQVITDPTSDFFTGVESLLINKSKAIWDKSFSELESITESSIDKYFTSKLELEFSCNKTFYEYPHTTLSYPREIDILNVIESKNVFKKRGDVFRKRQDVVDWFCNYWGYYSSDAIGIDDGDLTRVFDRSKTDNVSKKVGLRERVEFLVGGWKEGDAGLFKGDKI